MNSDTKRILRQHDNYHQHAQLYQGPDDPTKHFGGSRPWDRIFDGSFVVPALLLVLTVLYQTYAQAANRPSVLQALWDALVWILPGRLLEAVDGWLHPPLFPLPPRGATTADPMLQSQTRMTHAAKSEVLRRILGMDKGGGIMVSVSQAGRRGLNSLSSGTLGGMLKGAADQPPGLGNLDNSCYQNSILQGLAALKPLPTYLAGVGLDGDGGQQGQRENTRTTDTLRDLIAELNDASNNGTTLWTPSVLKNMSTWQQQDAQEYFSKLLDEIDKEIAKAAKGTQKPVGLENNFTTLASVTDYCNGGSKDDSAASQHSDDSGYQSLSTHSKAGSEQLKMVKNPLEGLAAQRVACVACGYSEGLSLVPFNCLTLPLGTDQAEHDLYERLDNYTKVEPIPGVECAKCTLLKYRNMINTIIERSRAAGRNDEDFPEPFMRLDAIDKALEEDDFEEETLTKVCKIPAKGRVSSTKTKQTVIARPPQSLAVHMNRSVFDETTGAMFKNLAAVRFPLTLDLGPWCLGSADGLTSLVSESDDASPVSEKTVLSAQNMEQWLLDPLSSMVAGDLHPSKITGPIYELRAVVTHYGRHENGHYVCFRQHPRISHENGNDVSPKGFEAPAQLVGEEHDNHDDVDSDKDNKTLVEGEDGSRDQTINDEIDKETLRAHPDTDQPSPEQQGPDQKALDSLPDEPCPPPQWWRLSDQDVSKVDEETVLAQGGVFMLFYDCVDPNSVLTSDVDAFVDSIEAQDSTFDAEKLPQTELSAERDGEVPPVGLPQIEEEAVSIDEDPVASGREEDVVILASSVPLPSEGEDDDLA